MLWQLGVGDNPNADAISPRGTMYGCIVFTALLDTSVLWPSLQRDFLLSLAIEGMYRPVWSSAILDELEYHEARKLVTRGVEECAANQRARYLVEQMRSHFDDAEVQGWQPLEGTYGPPIRTTNTSSRPPSWRALAPSPPITRRTPRQ